MRQSSRPSIHTSIHPPVQSISPSVRQVDETAEVTNRAHVVPATKRTVNPKLFWLSGHGSTSSSCYLRFLEHMHFASTGARFLRFSLKSCFCNFHACLVQKINQKSFQNEVRTHPKSMPKTSRFLTSIFWGSGLDFDGFWRGLWERFGGLGGSLGRLFGRR